jgi:DNA-binding protein H-NS
MTTENNTDAIFEMIQKLSLEQVLSIQADVNEFSSTYQKRKIAEIIADLKISIKNYKLNRADLLAEITESLSNEEVEVEVTQKIISEPKYRNPDNPNQTWTGRGPKPKWLEKLCVNGKTLDDFSTKKFTDTTIDTTDDTTERDTVS